MSLDGAVSGFPSSKRHMQGQTGDFKRSHSACCHTHFQLPDDLGRALAMCRQCQAQGLRTSEGMTNVNDGATP